MEENKVLDAKIKLVRSRSFKGSVKKAERITTVVRKWLPISGDNFQRRLYSLRLSKDRRAKDLASFLNYLNSSFGAGRVKEIYVEKGSTRRRYRWKHTSLVVHARRRYNFVARLFFG